MRAGEVFDDRPAMDAYVSRQHHAGAQGGAVVHIAVVCDMAAVLQNVVVADARQETAHFRSGVGGHPPVEPVAVAHEKKRRPPGVLEVLGRFAQHTSVAENVIGADYGPSQDAYSLSKDAARAYHHMRAHA